MFKNLETFCKEEKVKESKWRQITRKLDCEHSFLWINSNDKGFFEYIKSKEFKVEFLETTENYNCCEINEAKEKVLCFVVKNF